MMSPSNQLTAKLLTYVGTLPLVIAAVELVVGRLQPSDVVWMASTYSAIILSFLAGIHWACYLFFAQTCPRNLLLTSNAVALLAWLSLLVPQHQPWQILLQILCFLYVLTLDCKLHKAEILPTWFYILRRNATVIVVLSISIIMSQV
jgi:hypothetical protein